MILNCYLFIFRVQSKQKKGICANIFMTKCVYEPFIELLKVFFNLFKYKTRTAIKKGSSHHCGLPLIRELFKKSSYYQYLFLSYFRLILTLHVHTSYIIYARFLYYLRLTSMRFAHKFYIICIQFFIYNTLFALQQACFASMNR